VLQVVAVAFSYFAVDSLLNPDQLINQLVLILLKQIKSELVLVVDHPYKQEPISLKFVERELGHDVVVVQGIVVGCNSSGWITTRKNPWRVHCNHIEQPAPILLLSLNNIVKQPGSFNICRQRNAKLLPLLILVH
jgi:hypothetical protein